MPRICLPKSYSSFPEPKNIITPWDQISWLYQAVQGGEQGGWRLPSFLHRKLAPACPCAQLRPVGALRTLMEQA